MVGITLLIIIIILFIFNVSLAWLTFKTFFDTPIVYAALTAALIIIDSTVLHIALERLLN